MKKKHFLDDAIKSCEKLEQGLRELHRNLDEGITDLQENLRKQMIELNTNNEEYDKENLIENEVNKYLEEKNEDTN